MKKLLLSLLFICVPCLVLSAELPAWVKSGKNSKYPQDQFLTSVGKGETENDASADAQRNILQAVTEILVSNGIEKAKVNISPATLLKSFEKGYSYNDKADKTYYVFGVIDKNMVRINIEDDLYAAAQALQYRTAIYETSNLAVIPKIKSINELLELYDRRDSIETLKEALTGSVINARLGEFEREKLVIEKRKLFNNVVYYIKAENFNTEKLRKFLDGNDFDIISELPATSPGRDKAVAVINCTVQINKTPGKDGIMYDWIADFVLNDAFNENTDLYSNTSAGDETGNNENEARLKAEAAAETEMNSIAEGFFKNIN